MAEQVSKVTMDVLSTRKVEGVGKKSGKPYAGVIVDAVVDTKNGRKAASFLLFGYEGPEIVPGPQSFDFRLSVSYNGSIEFRPAGPSAR